MKVVIAGGTGFLGRPLTTRLLQEDHEVVILTRGAAPIGSVRSSPAVRGSRTSSDPDYVRWAPDGSAGEWMKALNGATAVVNLAGESIADHRWTASQKARIRESRILATRSLVAALGRASNPPRILMSGSAVGYYGDSGDRTVTERDPAGSDFLASLALAWEKEAVEAQKSGVRVVLVRTGIVLARDGGALEKLLPPFKLFVGGPVGSGRQYWSWIHRDDWIALVVWLLTTNDAHGAFNATAPAPVTNAEFSKTLGAALGRPSWLPAPAFAMRLALGEMADAMLLAGQRVIPERALSSGFQFRYPALGQALNALLP